MIQNSDWISRMTWHTDKKILEKFKGFYLVTIDCISWVLDTTSTNTYVAFTLYFQNDGIVSNRILRNVTKVILSGP